MEEKTHQKKIADNNPKTKGPKNQQRRQPPKKQNNKNGPKRKSKTKEKNDTTPVVSKAMIMNQKTALISPAPKIIMNLPEKKAESVPWLKNLAHFSCKSVFSNFMAMSGSTEEELYHPSSIRAHAFISMGNLCLCNET